MLRGKQRLNEFVSSSLRQSVVATYQKNMFRSVACIGTARWEGVASLSNRVAENNAAWAALNELSSMNEQQIRDRIGFPLRPHVSEMDEVRDVLKRLKARMRQDIVGNRWRAFCKLGVFYRELDDFERLLINSGLYD